MKKLRLIPRRNLMYKMMRRGGGIAYLQDGPKLPGGDFDHTRYKIRGDNYPWSEGFDDPIPHKPYIPEDTTVSVPETPYIPPQNNDDDDPLIREIKAIRAKYPDIDDETLINALRTGKVVFNPGSKY